MRDALKQRKDAAPQPAAAKVAADYTGVRVVDIGQGRKEEAQYKSPQQAFRCWWSVASRYCADGKQSNDEAATRGRPVMRDLLKIKRAVSLEW